MRLYPKINSLYKRDEKGKFIFGEFARPEFEYLGGLDWIWTEKVDGTNIRLGFDPEAGIVFRGNEHLWIGGRTERAQIHASLLPKLMDIQKSLPYEDHFDCPVTLYGEGYGARIQKGGGNYIPDGVDFVLFDVMVGDTWLDFVDVVDVGKKLNIQTVPYVMTGSISKAEEYVSNGTVHSAWGNHFTPEGLVGRPATALFNKKGERILCKIKDVDYR